MSYITFSQIQASLKAGAAEKKMERESLAGRELREISIKGIKQRAQEVKQKIADEQAREKPDMVRLARLREIEKCIASTLERCR
ncbi:MAG: hypothetical protein E7007_03390 [Alphaproteobacteria bacterium]|nr:hypothetical protein [Alphaproteobacteria bacterium]